MLLSKSLDLVRCLAPCPLSAADNMALDDVLLDEPGWFIRRTRWDSPAVTIGRFQQWPRSDRQDTSGLPLLHPFGTTPESPDSLPTVRRITGGGAIVHGEDLTIAIAGDCPSATFPRRRPTEIAARISAILAGLFDQTASSRQGDSKESSMQEIANCFGRQAASDVVVTGIDGPIKAGGIALAFRAGRVLIEASLRRDLLAADPADDLSRLVRLAKTLGLEPQQWQQGTDLLQEYWARKISDRVRNRFGNPHWNRR
ncbi:MAG: hypothetical protein COB10_05815 [Planctomycetota bacterium]|nr:MAG: hypothetical protein COB10_05815 [Planctomycetota bacterium]